MNLEELPNKLLDTVPSPNVVCMDFCGHAYFSAATDLREPVQRSVRPVFDDGFFWGENWDRDFSP